MSDLWGADVRISMPEVPKRHAVVPMGGFGFGFGGLVLDIDEATLEELQQPTFLPPGGVHGDE